MAMVAVLVAVVLAGCAGAEGGAAGPSATRTTLSTMEEVFRGAHLSTPGGLLTPVGTTVAEVAATLAKGLDSAVPLLLPGWLPAGFSLAAPFRGTGSGASLPNPHIWVTGYAVTFTDGDGRLTVVVGPDQEVSEGPWVVAGAALDGRQLRVHRDAGLVVVETGPGDGIPVVVVGERLTVEEVVRVAAGLRDEEAAGR